MNMVSSTNFLLYRILDGDKSDGIPGIKGAWFKKHMKMFPWLRFTTQVHTRRFT